jgi:hypothetical protein
MFLPTPFPTLVDVQMATMEEMETMEVEVEVEILKHL